MAPDSLDSDGHGMSSGSPGIGDLPAPNLPAGSTPSEPERHVEEAMLAEARADISYADHKASMVLAALGIGFSALLGGLLANNWRPTDLVSWGEAAWWIGGVCALASVIFAGLAVWPRVGSKTPGDDVYYWGDVCRFASVDALTTHLDQSPIDVLARTRNQLWVISGIVARKYLMIRRSMALGLAAVALFLLVGVSILMHSRKA
jgi:hypothetical protein